MTDLQDLELVEPEKVHLPLWKEDDLSERDEFVGYPISLKRMLLYCLATWFIFGMGPVFIFVWFYKHFRSFIKSGSQGSVATVLVSWLSFLTFFKLCSIYQERAENRNERFGVKLYDAPVLFFCASILAPFAVQRFSHLIGANFVYTMFLSPIISLLPLLYFQHRVNTFNKRLLPDKQFAPPITKAQWIFITLGLLWSLVLATTLFFS